MKKLGIILLACLVLAGCGGESALETITDVQDTPVLASVQKVLVQLPPEIATPVMESDREGTLYLCDDYALSVQTVESGDLEKTILNTTGMNKDNLQIIETQQGDVKRYQWVWTTTGENGIQVGRCCILDDGAYHYVLTALTDESLAHEVQPVWREIFASFRLTTDKEEVSTGS